jgi:fructose-1,6-bisphosphatase/inositol monophosphatase family enzyme
MQGQPEGLCCHPYDCASMLIAEEAGVVLTDENGKPLDGPLDVTSGISWVGYANAKLRDRIQPFLTSFLSGRDK